MLAQIDSGLSWKGMNATLEEFMEEWLEASKIRLKPGSIYDYAGYMRRHIIPALGKIKLSDLKPGHIQAFYSQKQKEGASRSTLKNIHSTLHRALNQAAKWGYILSNPANVVDKPKTQHTEKKTWDETEVISFLSSIEGSLYHGLFYLAVITGLRKGELLGLKWQDLDWTSGELHIQRQLRYINGRGLKLQDLKTAASRRVVVLGKNTIEMLRNHNILQNNARIFSGEKWTESELIFTSDLGTPLHPDTTYRVFKRLLRAAGLPDIRFHDLRHTAATLMLKQGIHPKVVQERLGHADIAMTLNTYSHVIPSMQKEAAEKMDELLTPIKYEDVFVSGNINN